MSFVSRCLIVTTISFVLTACAGGAVEPVAAPAVRLNSEPSTTTEPAPPSVPPSSESAATVESPPTSTMGSGPTSEDPPLNSSCRRVSEAGGEEPWVVVNDNVMGGRSVGELFFLAGEEGELLSFEGVINTDGGGFSSIRLALPVGALDEATSVVIRARPDERAYMLSLDDQLPGRDPRVSHRAPIRFDDDEVWQTVTIALEDLEPARFGRPVESEPFRQDLATELTLMISDGFDGPFSLAVDWIDACS